MRHEEQPGKGQTDLAVDRFDALHQSVNGDTFFNEQPFSRPLMRSWNEAELAPAFVIVIPDIKCPMREDWLR